MHSIDGIYTETVLVTTRVLIYLLLLLFILRVLQLL